MTDQEPATEKQMELIDKFWDKLPDHLTNEEYEKHQLGRPVKFTKARACKLIGDLLGKNEKYSRPVMSW